MTNKINLSPKLQSLLKESDKFKILEKETQDQVKKVLARFASQPNGEQMGIKLIKDEFF